MARRPLYGTTDGPERPCMAAILCPGSGGPPVAINIVTDGQGTYFRGPSVT